MENNERIISKSQLRRLLTTKEPTILTEAIFKELHDADEDRRLLMKLISKIDLIMHDKQYRFKNEDGTWYSREACKDISSEEVYHELAKELEQLSDLCDTLQDIEKIVPLAKIGTRLYMIPTETNGLNQMQDYTLISIDLSDIGVRYHLSLNTKQSDVEQFYAASEEMFGISIFTTKNEAQAKLNEIRR